MSTGRMMGRLAAALAAMAIAGGPVLAQGCVMCKTAVAGGGPELVRKINIGVLLLIIPVVVLFVGIFSVVYRYRNSFDAAPAKQNETVS